MAQLQGQVGIVSAGDGASPNVRQERTGGLVVTDAHGRYYETIARGNAYKIAVSAGAATAFTGGAAGTPLLGVFNPVNSGKNLSIIRASLAGRVAASGAGTVEASLYKALSAAPTGTITAPTNALTENQGGSAAQGVVNTAATSTLATTLCMALATYYWATAAAAFAPTPSVFDIAGGVVVAPGVFLALGLSAALTSATWSAELTWEEIPV